MKKIFHSINQKAKSLGYEFAGFTGAGHRRYVNPETGVALTTPSSPTNKEHTLKAFERDAQKYAPKQEEVQEVMAESGAVRATRFVAELENDTVITSAVAVDTLVKEGYSLYAVRQALPIAFRAAGWMKDDQAGPWYKPIPEQRQPEPELPIAELPEPPVEEQEPTPKEETVTAQTEEVPTLPAREPGTALAERAPLIVAQRQEIPRYKQACLDHRLRGMASQLNTMILVEGVRAGVVIDADKQTITFEIPLGECSCE